MKQNADTNSKGPLPGRQAGAWLPAAAQQPASLAPILFEGLKPNYVPDLENAACD